MKEKDRPFSPAAGDRALVNFGGKVDVFEDCDAVT